jgi:hypothetical protein
VIFTVVAEKYEKFIVRILIFRRFITVFLFCIFVGLYGINVGDIWGPHYHPSPPPLFSYFHSQPSNTSATFSTERHAFECMQSKRHVRKNWRPKDKMRGHLALPMARRPPPPLL